MSQIKEGMNEELSRQAQVGRDCGLDKSSVEAETKWALSHRRMMDTRMRTVLRLKLVSSLYGLKIQMHINAKLK